MAKISIKAGTASKLLDLFISDSSSTTGAGLTGLVFNTASLTAYYYREGAGSATAITLATMTLGTWATGGFVVIDGTNMPGCYQLAIPDAAIAAGAKSVIVMLKGATNMAPLVLEVELTATDNQSATAFITGINSLAPPTNWNLTSIDASGRVDVAKIAGTAQTARDIGASVLLSTGTGTGQLDFTAGVVKANSTQFAGQAITAAAGVTLPSTVASPTNITAGTITTVTNLTNAPTAGDLTATMKTSVQTASDAAVTANALVNAIAGYIDTEVAAIKAKTDNLPANPATTGDAMTLTAGERNSVADALLARNVAGGSSAGRLVKEALYVLRNKVDVAAGTLTVYGTDDSTAAFTAVVTTTAGNPISTIDPA